MSRLQYRVDLLKNAVGTVAELGRGGLGRELDDLRASNGQIQVRLTANVAPGNLREAEFSTFSQFGEDGIIQHLIRHVPIENDVFVEFGVADYKESNTRFLLYNDNWRGLVIDGGTTHIDFLRDSELMWRHEIDAFSAFV